MHTCKRFFHNISKAPKIQFIVILWYNTSPPLPLMRKPLKNVTMEWRGVFTVFVTDQFENFGGGGGGEDTHLHSEWSLSLIDTR